MIQSFISIILLFIFPFQFFTVPATSQITFSKAISSTSIKFEWSSAVGTDRYILGVDKSLSPTTHYEQIFTTLSGQINNLQPSTAYNCYIYTSNAAGLGAKSLVKTIRTCKLTSCFCVVTMIAYKRLTSSFVPQWCSRQKEWLWWKWARVALVFHGIAFLPSCSIRWQHRPTTSHRSPPLVGMPLLPLWISQILCHVQHTQ